MNNRLYVIANDECWAEKMPEAEEIGCRVFDEALKYLKENKLGGRIGFEKPISMTLVLSNNHEVQALNAEFRGKDKPTNVLSFANIDDEAFFEEIENFEEAELGDIIMAFETLEAEAEIKNILPENHFAHLLVHGILHLFGYDHQSDDEADEMEGIEVEILQKLNISNPYEER